MRRTPLIRMSLQPSADGAVDVPLRLDVLPSVLQFLLSTRTGIEQHVAYQSLERLVLQDLGLGQIMPPERYDNLREFEHAERILNWA